MLYKTRSQWAGGDRRHITELCATPPPRTQEDSNLAQVEVDEVLRLVCDVRAKVAADDAVPGGVVLLVKLLLDVRGQVLLDVVLLQRLRRAVDGVLLHVLGHVCILDHGFAVTHGWFG
uniref:Uncharacterized protein n=1 Tax=Seriola lalandi dorsalis TaxID=1841481 RepID=A0A3B4WGY9_SERLL